ncbi:MAG TPA: Fe-S cluster assembly protein SufD [Gemmatimonadaceae bacterium]|nr:Fe-S cluster assembly protein SufD [Gemmatimonadaceae bacterium]
MSERYRQQFDAFLHDGARQDPSWVNKLRKHGMESFESLGFPTTKNEDWHFTSVSAIAEQDFTFVAASTGDVEASDVDAFRFAPDWHTAVFVNGRFAPRLSSLHGLDAAVKFYPLADAWTSVPELTKRVGTIVARREKHAFTGLNSAFMPDGAVLHIGRDAAPAMPIHLVFLSDANAAKTVMYPRNLIVAERGSRATVVESYVSLGDAVYFTNAVTEVMVGDGATLEHYKVQRESRRAFHVGTVEAEQARDSHYISFSFAAGAELSRTNIYTNLNGEGCGSTLNGLYMLDGDQHCDHQTRIEHAQPNCFSREVYKGVLDGRSHGVFNGKVYVHPVAQKTDGKQTNNTLLLSKDAQVDTKPQLEIFADDVKCTHGATVGRLDDVALFYMKSRGVNAETARRLLIYAFAAGVLESIAQAEVRQALERVTLERFVKDEELSTV